MSDVVFRVEALRAATAMTTAYVAAGKLTVRIHECAEGIIEMAEIFEYYLSGDREREDLS